MLTFLRYYWETNSGRHQLIDSISEKPIITIEETCDGWQWERRTNFLLHRAHPGSGVESTLIRAKIAAIHDLPYED